jgi:hypothetical protein
MSLRQMKWVALVILILTFPLVPMTCDRNCCGHSWTEAVTISVVDLVFHHADYCWTVRSFECIVREPTFWTAINMLLFFAWLALTLFCVSVLLQTEEKHETKRNHSDV